VLMDSDLAPDMPLTKLSKAKRRIREEAEKDPTHRLAHISKGREVENDLPTEALLRGAAAVLDRPYDDLKDARLTTGVLPYEEEIIAPLAITEDAAKPIKRKLTNKVELASCVLVECKSQGVDLTPPDYV